MDIKEFAQKTIQRFGTHDPFDICNQLGIVILYLPLGRMRGYCYSNENGKAVVLHDGLAEYPGFLPLLLFRGGVPRFSSFPTVVGEHPIALAMALFV